jgi:hypothetical protein
MPTKKSVLPTSTTKKRRAKRVVVKTRKESSYNVIQKGIKDYCLRKYGKRCSRQEVSEIYQALKLRYADEFKNPKSKITPKSIADTIDEKLGYKDAKAMPTDFEDFEWYMVIDKLILTDGGYFLEDDILTFDLSDVGLGKVTGSYAELDYMYTEQIYPDMREYISDVEATTGIKMSPQPSFVIDEDRSDFGKRVFVWKLDFGRVEGREQFQDTPEGQKPPSEKKAAKSKAKESDAVILEREKTKQLEITERIAKEKTKQDALAAFKAGEINLETFKLLIS